LNPIEAIIEKDRKFMFDNMRREPLSFHSLTEDVLVHQPHSGSSGFLVYRHHRPNRSVIYSVAVPFEIDRPQAPFAPSPRSDASVPQSFYELSRKCLNFCFGEKRKKTIKEEEKSNKFSGSSIYLLGLKLQTFCCSLLRSWKKAKKGKSREFQTIKV